VISGTDVSGQPIGPIFKDQEFQEEKRRLDRCTWDRQVVPTRLCRIVTLRCVKSKNGAGHKVILPREQGALPLVSPTD